jgi:hypothetical protein
MTGARIEASRHCSRAQYLSAIGAGLMSAISGRQLRAAFGRLWLGHRAEAGPSRSP